MIVPSKQPQMMSKLGENGIYIFKSKLIFELKVSNNENLPENILPAIKRKDMPAMEKIQSTVLDVADNRGIKEKEIPKSHQQRNFLLFYQKNLLLTATSAKQNPTEKESIDFKQPAHNEGFIFPFNHTKIFKI